MKWFIPLAVLLVFGCSKQKSTSKDLLKSGSEFIQLNTKGNINPYSHYLKYYQEGDRSWLFYANEMANEMIIYSLPEGEIEKRIKYDERGPNGIGKLAGFLPHRMDSIFLFSSTHIDKFYLTDTTGLIKERYTMDTISGKKFKPFIRAMYSHLSVEGRVENDHIFLGTYFPYEVDNNKLHKEIINLEYDLGRGNISNYSNFPQITTSSKANLAHFSNICTENERAFSFFYLEDIYVLDNNGNYSTFPCKSKFQVKSLSNEFNRRLPLEEQMRQMVRFPKYLSFIYDKYRKCRYRFFYPGVDISDNEDPRKQVENRKVFSIIVMDDNYNVIGETLMPENTYNPDMSFVAEDGLYVALHFEHPGYDPDKLTFERLELINDRHEK